MNNYIIKSMNHEAAKQICGWQYNPPYCVYNYLTYYEAVKKQSEIIKTENANNYFCFWNNETLVAYTSIILKDEKVYIGIGIAPEFCGQGLGHLYLNRTVLEAQKRYPDKEIWVQVRSWNERAINCYCKCGFIEKYRAILLDRFNRNTEFVFMQYEINISFTYLNKPHFSTVATEIFNILADNMEKIAPTGNTRDEDYRYWFDGVNNGLMRDERQIILINDNDSIIGFFQYYTNADTFMMEEIQIKPEYHGKNIFRNLYGFLIENISKDIRFVEAYANIANHKSIGILEKLGLSKIGTNKNGRCLHFKGNYSDLIKWYESK